MIVIVVTIAAFVAAIVAVIVMMTTAIALVDKLRLCLKVFVKYRVEYGFICYRLELVRFLVLFDDLEYDRFVLAKAFQMLDGLQKRIELALILYNGDYVEIDRIVFLVE